MHFTPLSTNQTIKTEKLNEISCSTQSKASVKSDDDFDVNEYFARLQGTRYVSAPINSNLIEDSNANLEATEENLEEINLNEPEKSQTDIQQSLTADIAQNFSQLPTMLPQVASAVFSSFSNMLNMKSRENTPGEIQPTEYHDVHFLREENVPLMGVSESKEMAPPPKEPPTVGIGNYRLTTKKKYAQLPGLSTGETAHVPSQNMPFKPMSQNSPYFVPADVPVVPTEGPQEKPKAFESVDMTAFDSLVKIPTETENQATKDSYNFSNPITVPSIPKASDAYPNTFTSTKDIQPNIFVPAEQKFDVNISQATPQFYSQEPINMPPVQSNAGIIPPPPMFSNLSRRDSQTGVGKSILPPSVARRISANYAVMKPQAQQATAFTDNIFVSAAIPDVTDNVSTVGPNFDSFSVPLHSSTVPGEIKPPSAFASFPSPAISSTTLQDTSMFTSASVLLSSSSVPLSVPGPVSAVTSLPSTSVPTGVPLSGQPSSSILPPPPIQKPSASNLPPAPTFAAGFPPQNLAQNIPPPKSAMPPMSSGVQSSKRIIPPSVAPAMFTPASIPQSQSETNLPPPTFFNPNTLAPIDITEVKINQESNASHCTSQFLINNTPVEPPKAVIEPPKMTGNLNYRMVKKRPQYYAGPIEGVGAISNNVKPVLQPVETGAFQGALFTPTQQIQEHVNQNIPAPNIDQASVPFDISRPAETVQAYTPFELQKPQEQIYVQPEFNTAFDFSRVTTESYEPSKQENKGFGIIGSLKSKLGSLDINKIQNSVTTFFDPAYNDTKKEGQQDNVPYGLQQQSTSDGSSFGQYSQNQSSNFEIFVPSAEITPQECTQSYNYQTSFQNQNISDPAQNQHYYQTQNPFNYYQNQEQNVYPSTGYNTFNTEQDFNTNASIAHSTISNVQEKVLLGAEATANENLRTDTKAEEATNMYSSFAPQVVQKQDENVAVKNEAIPIAQNVVKPESNTTVRFFDQPQPIPPAAVEFESNKTDIQITPDVFDKVGDLQSGSVVKDVTSGTISDFFASSLNQVETSTHGEFTNFAFEEKSVDSLKREETPVDAEDSVATLDVSSVALLGLSSMLADKSKELTDLENEVKNISLNESKNVDTIFNRGANVSFFDDMSLESKLSVKDEKSDLDICETCREVTKPDAPEIDLTAYLIENITSPIQLLNPVEVPLTESNTPVDDRERHFDSNQCAEISHITEETIETIQIQSATELLDNDELQTNTRSYGWYTEQSPFAPKELAEHEYGLQMQLKPTNRNHDFTQNPLIDHEYGLQKTPSVTDHDYSLPNPSVIGFIGNNSMLMENIPKNASDEIKAEFKITHEETPVLLPRQMSISTAPPPEEDNKSDETGIDVHLIEQDAKKDFPFFEEFVIEPSETDDDKIEYKEREKSTEDIQEVDSFTNRVERFKKMGESSSDILDSQKKSPFNITSTTSPSLPMASYFDTGNYAAETHYRNTLASPNVSSFIVGSPNTQMRIPPGFEEEFERRMSGISTHDGENRNDIPYIPDCSTQTRTTYSPTFSTAQTKTEIDKVAPPVTKMSLFIYESKSDVGYEKQSDFSIFGVDKEEFLPNIPVEIPSVFTAPESTRQEDDFVESRVRNAPINIYGLGESYSLESSSKLPDFSNIFDAKKEETPKQNLDSSSTFSDQRTVLNEDILEISLTTDAIPRSTNIFNVENVALEKPEILSDFLKSDNTSESIQTSQLPAFSEVFDAKTEISNEGPHVPFVLAKLDDSIEKSPEKPQQQSLPILPDPINFFSSNIESTSAEKSEVEDNTFSRLASYFASPAKTDNSKSFFELSQGQDHYRRESKPKDDVKPLEITKGSGDTASNVKSFFELRQSQNHYIDNVHNLPQDKYLANLNLMKDLTSIQNIEVETDQTVRTVNYFTVEYNNEHLDMTTEYNIGEPETVKKEEFKKDLNRDVEETAYDDETVKKLIKNCKYCCNVDVGYMQNYNNLDHESIFKTDFKVKKGMDNSSEAKKESEVDMDQSKDGPIRDSVTVNFGADSVQQESNEGVTTMVENRTTGEYVPVKHHWFYRVDVEGKSIWRGFSIVDSKNLEEAYHSPVLDENTLVATDGGRFDVNVVGRLRLAVYWADKPTNVRRCSWFYKGTTDARYVPYTEAVAEKLEEEYRHGITTGEWHRRLVLPNSELVVMHGPAVMVHFLQSNANDAFSAPTQSTMRPRVVRRGCDDTEIEDIEPSNIDHLLLLCHGVGSACDMRFRSVEEVVDDFRSTSLQLVQSHYRNSFDNGDVGRIEVLPISWHATLHSGETGVDRRLARITLESIPRLRSFTNDTVLDVLFYTSPVFCQTILDTVCTELNRIYKLFCARNPGYTGGVSVGGHSLGSVILYDLLCHQVPHSPSGHFNASNKTYVTGAAGTGQPSVRYPTLDFPPVALYALGSPIAIFECIRGVESLGTDFSLPTCPNFFNIFHPYDPIAYRIEPLINPQLRNVKPFLIPHHKGRKRMHLELKDTMARVGADIKQKLIESIKSTWSNMWKSAPPSERQLEKVVEEEMEKEHLNDETKESTTNSDVVVTPEMLGQLNTGRRIDYVLQEAPFEMINEYIFAMSSHVCYWESEDTMLMILREIYDTLGVQPDCTVPQQSMTVQRTRVPKNGETIVMNASEHPSTSRDST